jgi:hypothetical protein
LIGGASLAQTDPLKGVKLDSLKQKLKADSVWTYRFKKFRPFFSLDNRKSFIRNSPVDFKGLQAGVIYKERHTVGLGIYRILQQTQRPVRTKDNTNRILSQRLTLNYLTLFYQYALIDKRYFEIDIPVEMGLGNATISMVDSLTQKELHRDEIPIIPLGISLQLVIKPFKWVGMSTMGGYRYVNQKDDRLNFSGWYYSFGLWVDVRQIYRDIKFYGFIKKKYKREVAKLV